MSEGRRGFQWPNGARIAVARHDDLAQWVLDNRIQEWTNAERFFPQTKRG